MTPAPDRETDPAPTGCPFLARQAAAPAPRTCRVLVLAGGPSAERDVSLDSGRAVADALTRRGHQVILADVAPDNLAALDGQFDVVFPALHGVFGEDGQVQALLDARKLPYVGSQTAASARAMDKAATKRVAEQLAIPTPRWAVAERPDDPALPAAPCAVKPVADGSSVGVTLAHDATTRDAAIARVLARDPRVLVEQLVVGREITVGILDGLPLPPILIQPAVGFYDYHAKYAADDTQYEFDTGLAADVIARAQADTRRIFEALGCRHLSRADWIVDERGVAWFLELNTMPGFTSHSLLPKAAERLGIPFDDLVERLIQMALRDRT